MGEAVPPLRRAVLEHLRGLDPSPFTSRVELDLGRALSATMPVDRVVQSFWDTCRRNHAARHMVEQAVMAWRADTVRERMAGARAFVERVVVSELGLYVKESGFLEDHADEIARAKRSARRSRG